jgi:PTS system ascorbate-specific IIA component
MSTGILIIAHAPLASALRATVLHALADCAPLLAALDVDANSSTAETLAQAESALRALHADEVLLVTDVMGATPFNVACQLQAQSNAASPALRCKLITGANVPMLLRAGTYCSGQGLDALMQRVKQGGINGIVDFDSATAQ